MNTAFISEEVKRPEREIDHCSPSRVEVKNEWSYNSTLPIRLHGVHGDNFTANTEDIIFPSVVLHVESFNGGLGTLYGILSLYILRVSVRRNFLDAFKGTLNLKPFCPGQQLEFKTQRH